MNKLLQHLKAKTDLNSKHVFSFFDLAEECGCLEKELDETLRRWNQQGYLENIFFAEDVFYNFSLSSLGLNKLF